MNELFHEFNAPHVPGVAAVAIRGGDVVWRLATGSADLQYQTAITSSSNFRLASVSKHMTAMAIMLLKDQGLLSFNDPVRKFFPDLGGFAAPITIRHLLTHQAGLIDYEDLIPKNQTRQVSDHDVRALMATQVSGYFQPGTAFRYSNGGYVLLGLITEIVSGLSFAEFLRRNFFEPLNMTATVAFENGVSTVRNRAFGHSQQDGAWRQTDQSVTSATLGDGGVYSSIDDLILWNRELSRPTLIDPDTMRDAVTPASLSDGTMTSYGFGWLINRYRNLTRHSHTGGTIGFRTAIQRVPERDFAVVVLCNRANAQPWRLAEQITDQFLFNGRKAAPDEISDSPTIPPPTA